MGRAHFVKGDKDHGLYGHCKRQILAVLDADVRRGDQLRKKRQFGQLQGLEGGPLEDRSGGIGHGGGGGGGGGCCLRQIEVVKVN